MTMTQASKEYFEQFAGEWDNLRAGYFGESVREAAIRKAYLRPEMAVADVGAGTGFMAAGLAPLVDKVHVIDGSAAMLEVARKNLAQFQNVEYHTADGQALPLPDASLDAVFANMYLHHCPDPLAAIQEMVRMLKPGGRLVITDMDAHPYTWLKEEMADEWLGFERSQVRGWYEQANLVNILIDCTGQSCCAESQNPNISDSQGHSARISVFVATGTRRITMRKAVQQAYTSAIQEGCGCGSQETQDSSSCCSNKANEMTQSVQFISAYSLEERLSAPKEAADVSFGCGNPVALANLRPGETVLDIGSGGGIDAFLAARQVGQTGKVIGVDMTPAMLERARSTATKSGFTNIEFRQGQAEALPVADSSVDVILSNCVINLCEDKGLVFREAFRTLKSGGRLEVSDIVTSAGLPLQARLSAGEWAGCVSGALPQQEYLDLIAQAGFEDIQVQRGSSEGKLEGVEVYSALVSARKPGGNPAEQEQTAMLQTQPPKKSSCCG